MPTVKTTRQRTSDRLLNLLDQHEHFVVVMHDNPDPDAIATAWALQTLIEEKLGKSTRLLAGGDIVRAENRHMVDLLGPPIQLVMSFDGAEDVPTILVDCGTSSGNQLLKRTSVEPLAIIDHHIDSCQGTPPPFTDLRPNVAATATIAASYLREQDVEPGPKLATALLYAIRTETRGSETQYTALDQEIVVWLTEQADPEMLAEIENAPLSRSWYSDLVLAMQSAILYGDAAISFLPRAEGSEIVGEVADLLVRGRGIRRVLCAAVVGNDLLISVRTTKDAESAAKLVGKVVADLGSGGGHARRAGGKISSVATEGKLSDNFEEQLLDRWLSACKVNNAQPGPLIARHEIVENL